MVWFADASWCFRDSIHTKDEAAVIKSAVRMRDLACMPWSQVVRTIPAGEKVRIIAESEWFKIIDSQWNIGRVWRDFITKSSNWSNIPSYTPDAYQTSFCSTLEKTKCPRPAAAWVIPIFYYQAPLASNTNNTSNTSTNTNNTSDYIPSQVSSCNISDGMKVTLTIAISKFKDNLKIKYPNDNDRNEYIQKIKKIFIMTSNKRTWTIKCIFEYIIELM